MGDMVLTVIVVAFFKIIVELFESMLSTNLFRIGSSYTVLCE